MRRIDGWRKIAPLLSPAYGGGSVRIVRDALAVVLALTLFAVPLAAGAQQAGKAPRIGFLSLTSASDRPALLAAELVRLKVDVLVSWGTQGVVSGSAGLEWVAKQLELLKETVPRIRRVAILSNPTNAYHPLAIKEANVAARSLGVQLQLLEARGPNEFDGAFAAMAKERAGGLLVLSDAMLNSHRTRLADLAARTRVPAAYGVRESVEAGFYRRAALYVDKILKGAKPAGLPVEQPTKFELVINLKDRQGARPDDPAVGAGARGSHH